MSPKFLFSILFLFALLFQFSFFIPSVSPLQAASSLVPCGLSTGDQTQTAPCTLCHLLLGLQNIINWVRNVMTAIAIAVIVGMGILYIVSAGNDQMMALAKGGIKASLIGFAVILCAWLIVNVILNLPIFNNQVVRTNWYTFSCNLTSSVQGSPTIATLPQSFTDRTAPSNIPPPTSPPVTNTTPSGASLTLTNGSLSPGSATTLTLSGTINPALGPITFLVDSSTISIPQATGMTTSVTVYPATPPGAYSVEAYQNGILLGTVTLTVLPLTGNGGVDPGGGTPYEGGSEEGGSCTTANAQGIRYNSSLPLAPLSSWTAQELFNYWKSLPDQTDELGGSTQWQQPVKFAMYSQANASVTNGTAFRVLVGPMISAQWINGHSYLANTGNFDWQTGIGTYTDTSRKTKSAYPASGIPRTSACVAGGGSSGGGTSTPTPFNGSCPGFGQTIVLNLNYAAGTQSTQYTSSTTFGNGSIVVATFVTPKSLSNGGSGGNVSSVHYPGPNAVRTASLSTSACDFTSSQVLSLKRADSPIIYISPSSGVTLKPSTRYYFNIKNVDFNGLPSCGASDGNCPISVALIAR